MSHTHTRLREKKYTFTSFADKVIGDDGDPVITIVTPTAFSTSDVATKGSHIGGPIHCTGEIIGLGLLYSDFLERNRRGSED